LTTRNPGPEPNFDDAPELGLSLDPVQPRPGLRAELMSRITRNPHFKPAHLLRAGEGAWLDAGIEGIQYRPLYEDSVTKLTTVLLKMAPGAKYPSHHHGEAEQCLVLEGDVQWADQVYRAGDFLVASKDTVHPVIQTQGGNVLLLIMGHNEFVSA
jgi:anti-sigma factor ChrR (cupin superfamily)